MINDFIDEVTSSGIDGILPQNLENKWFQPVLEASVEFLKIIISQEKVDPEELLNHEKGMLLLAAVTELIQHRYDYPAHFQINSVPKEHLYDSISCYSIAVLMEDAKRTLNIEIPEIDSENILEKDVISGIEESTPQLSKFFHERIVN